ncbi:hypothetical protein D1839_09055 [Roseburia sp. 1XD42-34]|nr:hypothetical protein [Roseburia sp. 1XD42-34]RKI78329.1 hypothetical protein D7V87_09105 [Clostridium sp. 1xD42-85]
MMSNNQSASLPRGFFPDRFIRVTRAINGEVSKRFALKIPFINVNKMVAKQTDKVRLKKRRQS